VREETRECAHLLANRSLGFDCCVLRRSNGRFRLLAPYKSCPVPLTLLSRAAARSCRAKEKVSVCWRRRHTAHGTPHTHTHTHTHAHTRLTIGKCKQPKTLDLTVSELPFVLHPVGSAVPARCTARMVCERKDGAHTLARVREGLRVTCVHTHDSELGHTSTPRYAGYVHSCSVVLSACKFPLVLASICADWAHVRAIGGVSVKSTSRNGGTIPFPLPRCMASRRCARCTQQSTQRKPVRPSKKNTKRRAQRLEEGKGAGGCGVVSCGELW
jgi:hypothetical protein